MVCHVFADICVREYGIAHGKYDRLAQLVQCIINIAFLIGIRVT